MKYYLYYNTAFAINYKIKTVIIVDICSIRQGTLAEFNLITLNAEENKYDKIDIKVFEDMFNKTINLITKLVF